MPSSKRKENIQRNETQKVVMTMIFEMWQEFLINLHLHTNYLDICFNKVLMKRLECLMYDVLHDNKQTKQKIKSKKGKKANIQGQFCMMEKF